MDATRSTLAGAYPEAKGVCDAGASACNTRLRSFPREPAAAAFAVKAKPPVALENLRLAKTILLCGGGNLRANLQRYPEVLRNLLAAPST